MSVADRAINDIKVKVASMAELTAGMCREGIKALMANDRDLADEVVLRDARVDALELELEEMCLRFLALQAPKALDLRYVVAVSRLINDLERIADHSKAIARQVHSHYCAPIAAALPDFARMTELVVLMLTEALEAFFGSNAKKYAELAAKDRTVGELQKGLNLSLVDIIAAQPDSIDGAVVLINIVRRLERIADHAKSIAVRIPYIIDGSILRHKDKAAHADNDN